MKMKGEISPEKIFDDNAANRRTRGKENGTIIKGSIYELSLIIKPEWNWSLHNTSSRRTNAKKRFMERDDDDDDEQTITNIGSKQFLELEHTIEYDLSRRSSRGGTSRACVHVRVPRCFCVRGPSTVLLPMMGRLSLIYTRRHYRTGVIARIEQQQQQHKDVLTSSLPLPKIVVSSKRLTDRAVGVGAPAKHLPVVVEVQRRTKLAFLAEVIKFY